MRYWQPLFIVLFVILLVGCGPVKSPPVAHYTLSPAILADQTAQAASALTLLVNQPVAAPGYDTDRIVYVLRPFQLQAYLHGQWAAPPAQMLTQVIAQPLQARHYFYAILTAPTVAETDFRLDIRVLQLQQTYLSQASEVRMALWVSLTNNHSQQIVATHTFVASIPAAADAYSGVLAANQAAQQLAQQIAKYVMVQVRAHHALPLDEKGGRDLYK